MKQSNPRVQFDAIIIGSGIGGLTVAAILSKLYRKKVLILEQHFTPGGLTHSFCRGKHFDWDVGINYIGEMGEGELGRTVFNYISDGKLQWKKLPDLFERFIYPGLTFDVKAGPKQFEADLIQKFPAEKAAIKRYLKDAKWASFWFITYSFIDLCPNWLIPSVKWISRILGRSAIQSTGSYLNKNFQDERIKALLFSQFATYGLPPSQSCFGMTSTIVMHYAQGAWYPVGGGEAIAKSIIPIIERSGGVIATQRRVTEILIESNKAVGVKVKYLADSKAEPEIYHAPIVISNIGIQPTYLHLIPPAYPLQQRKAIQSFPVGNSLITLYLGLKDNPEKLGFCGENNWIFTSYDHEKISTLGTSNNSYVPGFCLISFSYLKNPLAKGYSAEITTTATYEMFQQWQHKAWKKRGSDYLELKKNITQSILDLIGKHYPELINIIEYSELSTPLTFANLGGKDRGCVYGVPYIPNRFFQPWISARTPIKNLYLTGSDTCTSGVMGAMMGGLKTAGIVYGIHGLGFARIMAAMFREQKRYSHSKHL
ncbi:MAG: Phytoene dehydrogenase-related protein [Phormidesmis priestleyi Ana]|uniref:Phytoene dehydrogenase-related protein n=1 Tax=Phormidesmis priestleyi Ana TaxID=1666911 RepID=A0A0P7ZL02_9CYAN|nr:MAG: Phytoene dehydrogenase-related protein [Phormidesmis priestleyi Ana]